MDIFDLFVSALPEGKSLEEIYGSVPAEVWRDSPQLGFILALNRCGFDTADYLDRYPDVREAGMDPVQHYVTHGIREGRTFRFQVDASREGVGSSSQIAGLFGLTRRVSGDSLFEMLRDYDVVSFDIFDTAIFRRVEFPTDIFLIMAQEMNWRDFVHIRANAELHAREERERKHGDREITIEDIYDRLEKYHNVDKKWMARELELEKKAVVPNPYIQGICRRLQEAGIKVVFCSDMYLPKTVIQEMLLLAGYDSQIPLYLSNDLKLDKLNGSMQRRLAEDFRGQRIIHIGDNKKADYLNFTRENLDAIWNPDSRLAGRSSLYDNLSGSFYRAIINNELNNGSYANDIYYTHGFQVGGIIAAGYCQFINRIAREKCAEKIIFCGRDCYVLQKIYEENFGNLPNVYVETSRNVLSLLTIQYFVNYLYWGIMMPYWSEHRYSLTLSQLLEYFGLQCVIPLLDAQQTSRFLFYNHIDKNRLFTIIISNLPFISQKLAPVREAARKYYKDAVGDANKAVIVDVGWSGTGFEALEHFIRDEINPGFEAVGTLICAADSKSISSAVESGRLFPYISASGLNRDITEFLFPAGKTKDEIEKLHLPLEYLFTAPYPSLAGLSLDGAGEVIMERSNNMPENVWQIERMQAGMLDFCRQYAQTLRDLYLLPSVSPYMAFNPLVSCIRDEKYLAAIYGDFNYDSVTLLGKQKYPRFSSVLTGSANKGESEAATGDVLLVIHELTYTGSLTYLMQVAESVRRMGLEPVVWAAQDGPFRMALEEKNIRTEIVPAEKIAESGFQKRLQNFRLAICNTVCTADYTKALLEVMPTMWVIHEGKNLGGFLDDRPGWKAALREFPHIFAVSEYAANHIQPFAAHRVRVLNNSVTDHADMALPRTPGSDQKIKFCQIGSLERRKGYDILVKAVKELPPEYRDQCEVHFAGGFISGEVGYYDWLFNEIDALDNVFYHGQITELEEKIHFLSGMDVIVVASRDESCSLVALEGAMLSRPLIVTENVGAKYMVDDANGLIVKTADVEDLKNGLMRMIDARSELGRMGEASRSKYDKYASEEIFRSSLQNIIAGFTGINVRQDTALPPDLVISLTSSPDSIKNAEGCIKTLLAQDCGRYSIEYWLSAQDFPYREKELPAFLQELASNNMVTIRWTDENLKGYSRFLAALQPGRDLPVIVVDDNVTYKPGMARVLLESWRAHPEAISCHKADMMMFDRAGRLSRPSVWVKDFRGLAGTPSLRLAPDTGGGILVPPRILPADSLGSLMAAAKDYYDIWLPMLCISNRIPVVLAAGRLDALPIPQSRAAFSRRGLYHQNQKDLLLEEMLGQFRSTNAQAGEILAALSADV